MGKVLSWALKMGVFKTPAFNPDPEVMLMVNPRLGNHKTRLMIHTPTERSNQWLPKMPLFFLCATLNANTVEDGSKKRCTHIREAF
jgi:hypothetical protein